MLRKTVKRTTLIVLSAVLGLVILVIVFVSPITKYLVQKYDEKYTGRQITLGFTYVNPFTGFLHFSDLKIMEYKSDSVFFYADGVDINFAMLKLFSKTYEISDFELDHPRVSFLQTKNVFNFNDLIEKFTSDKDTTENKEPAHFNFLNIKISDGEFFYKEDQIPINYYIKQTNINSKGMKWDVDTVSANFSFLPGIGSGDFKGNFTINLKTLGYNLGAVINKFDLQIIGQYLKQLSNYGKFTANLDADIKASGNFNDKENITANGMIAINQFHFGKTPADDYLSFEKLLVTVDEISPKNNKYLIDSIQLSHPYFKYEKYDSLDNLQNMFGKNGSNISAVKAEEQFNLVLEIANYIKVLSKNFFKSNYKISHLGVTEGDIRYNDFSLPQKFSMALDPLSVHADSIDKKRRRVNISIASGIKPYGNFIGNLSINPNDSSDFDLQYKLEKMSLPLFNPYATKYTSFPINRGTVELHGKWNVRNGIINSDNHFVVLDPRLATRIKTNDTKWIPMRLVFFFVREQGNVVDYLIPIKGNLSDPKFVWRDLILDAIKNILIKPVTSPYITEVKTVETEIEKSLSLSWEVHTDDLSNIQKNFLEKMAEFLKDNKEASIKVSPELYTANEKEFILFYETKKKYYFEKNNITSENFNDEDSIAIFKMSVKDEGFVNYVRNKVPDSLIFTMQERCYQIIDSNTVNLKWNQLCKARQDKFLYYFEKEGVLNQVQFANAQNTIPYNGVSFYKVDYRGDYPKSLMRAYEKMDEFNSESPRKKFKQERKEIKGEM